ncbi:MAG: M20/M25/M40 family metallo-hydrolase [Chloroflexi bacterium]|nr:M20/M25/M40 family metallo-hydrolase [Chloroflexota bacterium]
MAVQFEGQRAYKHIEALSVDIGPRVSGTEAEKRAAEYVSRQLGEMGLKPQTLAFDLPNEQASFFKLEVLEPEQGEIPALPLVGTPDTPPEGINGEVVFAEFPQEPYVGPHIEGKIVFLANGGILGGNLTQLLKYKPLGLVLIGRTMSKEPNTFHVIRKETNKPFELVPTLHISYENGVKLWNKHIQRARITLKTERKPGQSYAVFAEVPGRGNPDEIVVIAGHMDSVPCDPGATDNAAGVATVLELARIFAQRGSRRTLRFAAWGSEEGAGGGSLKYVLELKKLHKIQKQAPDYIEGYSKTDLEKHILNINLDVLGMSLGSNECYIQASPALEQYLKALTSEMGIHHVFKKEIYGSDNITFGWVGVPAVSFARAGVGTHYMHTPKDDIELIDPGQLEIIGKMLDVFITRTAAEGIIWPFDRNTGEIFAEREAGMKKSMNSIIKLIGEDTSLID